MIQFILQKNNFGIIPSKKITTFLGNFFEIIILKKNLKIKYNVKKVLICHF